MRLILPASFLLASCGSGEEPPGDRMDLPQPSGPPVAQQADAVPSSAPKQTDPRWESVASGAGTALRLMDASGKLLLSIACEGPPPRLVATAPGFSAIGSEDRFSLGLGEEPVTLVANAAARPNNGVTAEGGVPEGFGNLIKGSGPVSAVYGAQQVGPVPAPPEALRDALAKSCTG